MEGDVKRAILLVDHGSKREEANRQLDRLAAAVREKSPREIVEFAHMEIAAPSIADGIARCVDGGAELIVVHRSSWVPVAIPSRASPSSSQPLRPTTPESRSESANLLALTRVSSIPYWIGCAKSTELPSNQTIVWES